MNSPAGVSALARAMAAASLRVRRRWGTVTRPVMRFLARLPVARLPILFLLCAFGTEVPVSYAGSFEHFIARVSAAPASARAALADSFMAAVRTFPLTEGDTVVHFVYLGNAASVNVPGDANGWNPSAFPMVRVPATDLWYYTCSFEPDARLDYKFVIDGRTWILDPRNPRTITGGAGPNSELRMPRYAPFPGIDERPDIPHGTLVDTVLYSNALGNSRTVRVYLPPGYAASTDSFPVILFHDGLEYLSLAQANNTLDFLLAVRRIRPVIAVFVPPVKRTQEYADSLVNPFSTFIIGTVLPYVDSRFRTRRSGADRAVVGASYGGNISLYLAYTYPAVFGHVAAQSSYVSPSLGAAFAGHALLPLTLYLDLGTYDIPFLVPMVRNFVSGLAAKGYRYRFREYHEGHSWGNWRAHLGDALEQFFPGPSAGSSD